MQREGLPGSTTEHARAVSYEHNRSSEAVGTYELSWISLVHYPPRVCPSKGALVAVILNFLGANGYLHAAVVFPLGMVPAGAKSCQD